MSTTLTVYIDEHWSDTPTAPWVLADERDRIIEQGQSDPRHWPAATDCVVVLSGTQCAWLETRLPKGSRGEEARLLRYALEDQLVRDVDEQHFSVMRRRAGSDGVDAAVLVVARARLRRLLAQFATLGRKPVRVVSELQTGIDAAPTRITLGPTGVWILHQPGQPAVACDGDGAAALFAHLLAAGAPDAVLALCVTDPAQAPDRAALALQLGRPVEAGPHHAWWQTRQATDLLHGEFARHGDASAWRERLRAPLLLAGSAAALWLLVGLGEVLWQRQQLSNLEERMRRVFETAVPNTPAVAPAQQLARSLDALRATHGQLRQDDFLALLDGFAEAGGSAARAVVTQATFENGKLGLTLRADTGLALPLLQARLATLGLEGVAESASDGGQRLSVTRRMQ